MTWQNPSTRRGRQCCNSEHSAGGCDSKWVQFLRAKGPATNQPRAERGPSAALGSSEKRPQPHRGEPRRGGVECEGCAAPLGLATYFFRDPGRRSFLALPWAGMLPGLWPSRASVTRPSFWTRFESHPPQADTATWGALRACCVPQLPRCKRRPEVSSMLRG